MVKTYGEFTAGTQFIDQFAKLILGCGGAGKYHVARQECLVRVRQIQVRDAPAGGDGRSYDAELASICTVGEHRLRPSALR